MGTVGRVIAWSFNVLAAGRWPARRHDDSEFAKQVDLDRRGSQLADGLCGALIAGNVRLVRVQNLAGLRTIMLLLLGTARQPVEVPSIDRIECLEAPGRACVRYAGAGSLAKTYCEHRGEDGRAAPPTASGWAGEVVAGLGLAQGFS